MRYEFSDRGLPAVQQVANRPVLREVESYNRRLSAGEPLARLARQIGRFCPEFPARERNGAEQQIVSSLFGQRRVNPSADLDEPTLRDIADTTGGEYFRARNPAELEQIYAKLDALETTEQTPEMLRPQRSLLHWPLGLAMLLGAVFGLVRLVPDSSSRDVASAQVQSSSP